MPQQAAGRRVPVRSRSPLLEPDEELLIDLLPSFPIFSRTFSTPTGGADSPSRTTITTRRSETEMLKSCYGGPRWPRWRPDRCSLDAVISVSAAFWCVGAPGGGLFHSHSRDGKLITKDAFLLSFSPGMVTSKTISLSLARLDRDHTVLTRWNRTDGSVTHLPKSVKEMMISAPRRHRHRHRTMAWIGILPSKRPPSGSTSAREERSGPR